MTRKIFFSYRRDDSGGYQMLLEKLIRESVENVELFVDVADLETGMDWRHEVKSAIENSDIVILLIGPNWLGRSQRGKRRIDSTDDPVRVEIEHAISRSITIIPVLLGLSEIPEAKSLPQPLNALETIHSYTTRLESFDSDAARLVEKLASILNEKSDSLDVPALANTEYYITWWNVENLFDQENSGARDINLGKRLVSELRGWDKAVLQQKIDQLAKIINLMNRGRGPDLIGLCEVENANVLRALAKRISNKNEKSYEIAKPQIQPGDILDLAIIYDPERITIHSTENWTTLLSTRSPNIFKAECETVNGNKFTIFANRWHNRLGGEINSRPYRNVSAENLHFLIQGIINERGADWPVFIMGDFSDEPYSESLTEYLLSTREIRRAISPRSRLAYPYNLMWPLVGQNKGTMYYDHPHMMDQFLVTAGFLKDDSAFRIKQNRDGQFIVRIGSFRDMIMKNSMPKRFGRPAIDQRFDPEGYSDHFPIMTVIEEIV